MASVHGFKFPYFMGILNVTPDSFSDGGRYEDPRAAVEHALEMQDDGAHIIDMGAESTRPGSEPVPPTEQLRRMLPVLQAFRKKSDLPVSIDTWSADVAEACLGAGANIINDVTGLRGDKRMLDVVRQSTCEVVLMHAPGAPPRLHNPVKSKDIVYTILRFFLERLKFCAQAGLDSRRFILDPGIGYGKTAEQNLEILADLETLKGTESPILIGVSRKRFLGAFTENDVPESRDDASVAAAMYAAEHGANILRVHNVRAHFDAAAVLSAIHKSRAKLSK